jgi:hypothetical protein
MVLEIQLCTRVMYHAHMEQHSRISATEETVMNRLYPRLERNPFCVMAFA